jgi:hypothetical protein
MVARSTFIELIPWDLKSMFIGLEKGIWASVKAMLINGKQWLDLVYKMINFLGDSMTV